MSAKREHTGRLRKARLDTEWSMLNARLGGANFKDHPSCQLLHRYSRCGPFRAPSPQWKKFRGWMRERVYHPLLLVQ